jgi:hypothetical protein
LDLKAAFSWKRLYFLFVIPVQTGIHLVLCKSIDSRWYEPFWFIPLEFIPQCGGGNDNIRIESCWVNPRK